MSSPSSSAAATELCNGHSSPEKETRDKAARQRPAAKVSEKLESKSNKNVKRRDYLHVISNEKKKKNYGNWVSDISLCVPISFMGAKLKPSTNKKLFTWLWRWLLPMLRNISHWQQSFSGLPLPRQSLSKLKYKQWCLWMCFLSLMTEAEIRRESRESVAYKETKSKPSKNNSFSQGKNCRQKTGCHQTTNYWKKKKTSYGWYSNFTLIPVTFISLI